MSSKLDLHLIGNSVVDEIFEVQRSDLETKQFLPGSSNTYSTKRICYGGLGNLLSVFKNTKLNIHVSTHIGSDENGKKLLRYFSKNNLKFTSYKVNETSSSLIISEQAYKKLHEKTSFVKWGHVSNFRNFRPIRSRWAHISYLDVLYKLNVSKIHKYYDCISADLCLNNPKKVIVNTILKNSKYLDFLFMSTNEVSKYTNLIPRSINTIEYSDYLIKLLELYKLNTTIILHAPSWVTICKKGSKPINFEFKNLIESTSVVGAGDKFAANFISSVILDEKHPRKNSLVYSNPKSKLDFSKYILKAHKKTLKTLDKNEEI